MAFCMPGMLDLMWSLVNMYCVRYAAEARCPPRLLPAQGRFEVTEPWHVGLYSQTEAAHCSEIPLSTARDTRAVTVRPDPVPEPRVDRDP